MAQYYYDLSIADANGIPAMPKGPRSPNFDNGNAKFGLVNGYFAQLGVTRGGTDAELGLAAGVNAATVEALCKASVSLYNYGADYNNSGGVAFFLRAQGAQWSGGRAKNGYYFALNGAASQSAHSRKLRVYTYENGGYGALDVGGSKDMIAPTGEIFTDFFFFRVRAEGTTLSAKAWKETEQEPAAWMLSTTNATFTGAGDVFLGLGRGCAFAVPFFSVGTDGDPAPTAFPGGNRTVAGTLRKPDNSTAAGYIVRCHHRATGALLGQTLSDAAGQFVFSIPLATTEPVYCLAIDQLGNSWAAPIKDFINPV